MEWTVYLQVSRQLNRSYPQINGAFGKCMHLLDITALYAKDSIASTCTWLHWCLHFPQWYFFGPKHKKSCSWSSALQNPVTKMQYNGALLQRLFRRILSTGINWIAS